MRVLKIKRKLNKNTVSFECGNLICVEKLTNKGVNRAFGKTEKEALNKLKTFS